MAKYILIKDYNFNYFSVSSGKQLNDTFKEGTIIEGKFKKGFPCPTGATCIVNSVDRVSTYINGKMPDENLVGASVIEVPMTYLRQLNDDGIGDGVIPQKGSGSKFFKSTDLVYLFGAVVVFSVGYVLYKVVSGSGKK